MDNLRGLLGVRRTDRKPNVVKGIDESVFLWFGNLEKGKNSRTPKIV